MPVIVSAKTVFPEHYYPQKTLLEAAQQEWKVKRASIVKPLEQFYTNVKVKGRYLAWPLERYKEPSTFEERNNAYIETALDLGQQTICALLDDVQISPQEIDQLSIVSTTGIAVPSLDARLMNRIPFSRRMKRLPLFGLGCMGGAAGIARTADYLQGHPQDAVILLAIELCSLTIQRDDLSLANLVASGLFGDGAAAVLMVAIRTTWGSNWRSWLCHCCTLPTLPPQCSASPTLCCGAIASAARSRRWKKIIPTCQRRPGLGMQIKFVISKTYFPDGGS